MTEIELNFHVLKATEQNLYMVEKIPQSPLPKHKIWQSPLLFPVDISDGVELDERLNKAGRLWISNKDMSPYDGLIITHKTAWRSYVFQRTTTPGKHSEVFVPYKRRLLQEGLSIPSPYPLIYQEL